MSIASSKLTAQGQISVPAEVRRKLGLGPGSVIEWEEDGDRVVVRRAGTHTSEELHAALFPTKAPTRRSLADLKDGIRRAVKERYARR
jgi:antitoxin PrlF